MQNIEEVFFFGSVSWSASKKSAPIIAANVSFLCPDRCWWTPPAIRTIQIWCGCKVSAMRNRTGAGDWSYNRGRDVVHLRIFSVLSVVGYKEIRTFVCGGLAKRGTGGRQNSILLACKPSKSQTLSGCKCQRLVMPVQNPEGIQYQ